MPDEPVSAVDQLDARGLLCPLPVRLAARRARRLEPGTRLEVLGTDPALPLDFEAWCHDEGHRIVERSRDGDTIRLVVLLGGAGDPEAPP
jgi:tRNA 2-thiouridine synthesizing protein A